MLKKTNSKANPGPTTIPPVLTGVAGEYFVAAELSRRGYIASISLRNTRGIDILATNQAATQSITIQCKTSQRRAKTWILNQKSEDFFCREPFLYFCGARTPDGAATFSRCSEPDSCQVYCRAAPAMASDAWQRWPATCRFDEA